MCLQQVRKISGRVYGRKMYQNMPLFPLFFFIGMWNGSVWYFFVLLHDRFLMSTTIIKHHLYLFISVVVKFSTEQLVPLVDRICLTFCSTQVYPLFCEIRVAQSFVFCVVFYFLFSLVSLFDFFSCCPLYCFSFDFTASDNSSVIFKQISLH